MQAVICAFPTPAMYALAPHALLCLVRRTVAAAKAVDERPQFTTNSKLLAAEAEDAGAHAELSSPQTPGPAFLPTGAMAASRFLPADVHSLILDALNPGWTPDLALQAGRALTGSNAPLLLSCTEGGVHPCRSVVPHTVIDTAVLRPTEASPPPKEVLTAIADISSESNAPRMKASAPNAVLMHSARRLLLAWANAPANTHPLVTDGATGHGLTGHWLGKAGNWSVYALPEDAPSPSRPPSTAVLLEPACEGPVDCLLPLASGATPWRPNPSDGRLVLESGEPVHGRQAYPEVLRLDGSLCALKPGAMPMPERLPEAKDFASFPMPVPRLDNELDLLRHVLETNDCGGAP